VNPSGSGISTRKASLWLARHQASPVRQKGPTRRLLALVIYPFSDDKQTVQTLLDKVMSDDVHARTGIAITVYWHRIRPCVRR